MSSVVEEENSFENFPISLKIPFNKLKFGKLLGEGSFGKVFKGYWKFQKVAIKQLKLKKISKSFSLKEFLNKVELMIKLNFPSIVKLYGISIDSGKYNLIMELMNKGSLFDFLHSKETINWNKRYKIAIDISSGLNHLHENNIVHRNLKSMNVLLDKSFKAKLTDFGLSLVKTETITTTKTKTNQITSSKRWMAPELFKKQKNKNLNFYKKADIYSFGMILWEIVSRKIPYLDETNEEIIIKRICEGEIEEIPKNCPKKFKKIILKCWKKNPIKRPSIEEITKEIQNIIQKQQQQSNSPNNHIKETFNEEEFNLELSKLNIIKSQLFDNYSYNLLISSFNGFINIVKFLIKNNSNINFQDKNVKIKY